MNRRTFYILCVTLMILVPTVALGTAAARHKRIVVEPTHPDMAVTSLVIGRLLFPPTRFTMTTTVCNLGDAVSPAGSYLTLTAQPMAGPLRIGDGEVRHIGTVNFAQAFNPGDCVVTNSFWNSAFEDTFGAENFGEWEFTATITSSGDTNPANDRAVARTAFPLILAGTGVGGFDLP